MAGGENGQVNALWRIATVAGTPHAIAKPFIIN